MNNIRLFSILAFLKGAYFYIPIFTLFLLTQGVPLSAVVIANVFWSLGAFIGEVPTGILADKYGQKLSIVSGYFLESLGILVVFFFPSVAGLYSYYAISGLAYSFLSGSEEALLYESTRNENRKDYQKIYGQFLSSEQFGYVIATTVAGILYQYQGPEIFPKLILLTALCFAGSGFLALLLKDYRTKSVPGIEGSGMITTLKESFALIRNNSTIFNLTIVSLLTVSGQYLLQAVYQPHFEAHSVPPIWIGLVVAIGTLANSALLRSIYLLEDRFTLEKILLFINAPLGILFLLMAFLVHPIILVALYIGMNGLFNLQIPIISDYINPRTSSHIRTTVLSGMSFIKRFFELFLGVALGKIVGAWGVEAGLLTQGVYLLVGIGISYYLLVKCGCTHKIHDSEGEKLEFNTTG